MNAHRQRILMIGCLSCVSFFLPNALAKKPDKPGGGGNAAYSVLPLPDENGNTDFDGYASGQNEVWIDGEFIGMDVVGNAVGSSAYHWALDVSGVVLESTALPMPATAQPGDVASAHDVNDAGMIVGSGGAFSPLVLRPLLWLDTTSVPTELPIPAGHTGTAVDINNDGMVVGQLKNPVASTQMAAVWQLTVDESGPAIAGPVILAEATTVWAPSLSDAGDVVANVSFVGQQWNVSWDGTNLNASAPQSLTGTLVDQNGQSRDVTLEATAINEVGDVCGEYNSQDGDPLFGAFLLLADGTLLDLPPLSSKRYRTRSNIAYDLNDATDPDSIQIVGDVAFYSKRSGILHSIRGVVWQGGNATDLDAETAQPESDLELVGINKVSNHGWLSGFGWNANNDPRAIMVVPR